MNLLAIETSTSRASVALLFRGKLFVEEEVKFREHARVLLVMIEALLREANTNIEALDGIIFGEGPGSFTGIRIACSVAKGLAYAHDLPLYPVNGLRAIAFQVCGLALPVLTMLDARMHEVYWAFRPELGGEAFVSPPEAVQLPEGGEIALAGAGLAPYLEALPIEVKERIVSQHDVSPDARAMIRIVEAGGIQPVTAEQAMPAYVRQQVTGGGRG